MSKNYSGKVFRLSIIYYTGGRLLNALAGFSILIWISRRLSAAEYSNYIAAYAMLEIGMLVSGFGLEWVTVIFLPQMQQKASGRAIQVFVMQCVAAQALLLFLGGAVLFALAPMLAGWLGLGGAVAVVRAYAVVMCIEGISRVFRDQLLACLMMQSAAQTSQLARNVCMLGFVFFALEHEAWRTAEALAVGELFSSTFSLLMAAWYLFRKLAPTRHDPASEPGWTHPGWRKMLQTGRNAWIANFANLTWGPQAVILLATRIFGTDATAPLGFARNLAEQVRKYMPMEFLFSIVRTLLVVRYAAEGSVARLGARISMMYKGNLLFLLPLMVVAIVRGDQVCDLLSAGRYGSAHWLLVGWLSVFVMLAHRRLTDLLAHALGRSIVTTRVSLVLLLTPVCVWLALQTRQWPLLFLILFGVEFCYTSLVIGRMKTEAWRYAPYWPGLLKCAIATLAATLALWVLPLGNGAWALLLCSAVSCAVLWGLLYVLGIWSREELELVPAKLRKYAALP
ncbi:lipopolysaccharide biosynthesis protein [Duganella violaceipulchra]|uniref:O-antigen/teichoic acid export membrane protein n=1 Tax=Duganella violaceipulchra TaxID=2849652 RepID=A0AA41H5R3_9BURK|nr:oligosaccharide flippase family protein [Duganella violaceicalia]MBV6319951.1 oligosaccharide flippase family protein [Duganella violaceicalia]MCP2010315.1 O-antigen/teichoic acid export membrane protein [Duganella violaceicalia]